MKSSRYKIFIASFAIATVAIFSGCRDKVNRVEWMTMGTVAAIQTRGANAEQVATILRDVKKSFAIVEEKLNAHNKNSELSRIATKSDDEILAICSRDMKPCYEMAFAMTKLSRGAFNPRWRGVATLDLGAIAKGFALDFASSRIARNEDEKNFDLLLDLGGNLLAIKGDWRVGVASTSETLILREATACATSAEYFRGKHIFDARTGNAVSNGVMSVTVIASSAMKADALSTTLFILGRDEGEKFLCRDMKNEKVSVIWK